MSSAEITTDGVGDLPVREKLQNLLQQSSEELQQAYRDMSLISEISREMISARSSQRIVELLFEAMEAFLPQSKSAFLEWDSLSTSFYCIEDQGLSSEERSALSQHRDIGYYDWAIQERRTLVIPENLGKKGKPLTSMVVPLIGTVETLGVIEVFAPCRIGDYTQRDLSLITTVANQAAVAMENAQLYAKMELKTEAMARMKNYLTNILQSIGTGMIVLDTDGKITLFNQAAENLLAISAEAAVGNYLAALFKEPVLSAIDELCQKALQTYQDAITEIDYEKPTKSLPLEVKSSLLRDESGSVLGVMLLFTDLTETRELINLRHIDKLKDQFITTVSHELRTPLTAIKSFAEILLSYDERDQATQREFLTIINDQSDHLTKLIDEILDLSKFESGTAKWEITEIDLPALVRHVVSSSESIMSRKNLHVDLQIEDGLPSVWGDEEKLTRVVVNLLDNAAKFSPEKGEVRVAVKASHAATADKSRPAVEICVQDHGPGIPPEDVDRIFDKFHQVGDLMTEKPQGTGLGLAISREIVRYLGGSIWAESKPGEGATFHVLLPACDGRPFEPHAAGGNASSTPLAVKVI